MVWENEPRKEVLGDALSSFYMVSIPIIYLDLYLLTIPIIPNHQLINGDPYPLF